MSITSTIQRHSGVGSATAGVVMDDRGWWVDKACAERDSRVRFDVPGREKETGEPWRETDRVISLEARLADGLRISRERMERGEETVRRLEGEVSVATAQVMEAGRGGG